MIEKDIISDVADIYGIEPCDVSSKCRVRRFADARTVACYLLYSIPRMTYAEIGRALHVTHASAIYHKKKADDWLKAPVLNRRGACAINELKKRYGNVGVR